MNWRKIHQKIANNIVNCRGVERSEPWLDGSGVNEYEMRQEMGKREAENKEIIPLSDCEVTNVYLH